MTSGKWRFEVRVGREARGFMCAREHSSHVLALSATVRLIKTGSVAEMRDRRFGIKQGLHLPLTFVC